MAPSSKARGHEEDAVYRGAGGDDPPRGRRKVGPGGGQETRRRRTDDLCVAEALRHVGARRRETAAATRARKRSAETPRCGARSRHRGPEGDHPKKMVGARVRRQQVAYAETRGLSRRRACALLSVARSTLGYTSRLAVRDAPAIAAMRELAAQYPRYGYRRIR